LAAHWQKADRWRQNGDQRRQLKDRLRTALTNLGEIERTWKAESASASSGAFFVIQRKLDDETQWTNIGQTGAKSFSNTTVPLGTARATYTIIPGAANSSARPAPSSLCSLGLKIRLRAPAKAAARAEAKAWESPRKQRTLPPHPKKNQMRSVRRTQRAKKTRKKEKTHAARCMMPGRFSFAVEEVRVRGWGAATPSGIDPHTPSHPLTPLTSGDKPPRAPVTGSAVPAAHPLL